MPQGRPPMYFTHAPAGVDPARGAFKPRTKPGTRSDGKRGR